MEKMNEFYTINEMSTITGLTTRTLRNYLKLGILNGEKIEGRNVKVNWVTTNQSTDSNNTNNHNQNTEQPKLSYDEVFSVSPVTNTNVFIGNINKIVTKDELKHIMSVYGEIIEIKWNQEKTYGFVKFKTHEQATNAIVNCNGFVLHEYPLKCSWGKEQSQPQ